MKLSIIIPIHNEEKFLDACINSILRQSKQDIELILVNDGSTDRTREICDLWTEKDTRIRTFHCERQGTLMSRKVGVSNVNTEYLTFVDADDFVDRESFIKANEYMEKSIDIICFGIRRYFDDKYCINTFSRKGAGVYSKEEISNMIFEDMIWDGINNRPGIDASLCTKVIKTELMKKTVKCVGDFDLDIGDDAVLTYPSIFFSETLALSDDIYYNHRQRSPGVIAPYFKKDDYFDKLFRLYCVLREIFDNDNRLRMQLDQMYVSLIREKSIVWGGDACSIRFIFPFDKVQKNSNIVLYGAGKVGKDYYTQLENVPYCNIIAWVDKNWRYFYDKRIGDPSIISNLQFDHVVISVKSPDARKIIINELVGVGIPKNKIIEMRG